MRQNKGYHQKRMYAGGENKTLDQVIEDIENKIKWKIIQAEIEYKICKKNNITDRTSYFKSKFRPLLEIRFDKEGNLISLSEVIKNIKNTVRRNNSIYNYQKKIIHKDNQKFVYNGNCGGSNKNKVRIPSLKRSNRVWKNFYILFPWYEEASHDAKMRKIYHLKEI